jgi:hypothetical protein
MQVMLSGLHELANKMSDPFGDDESDLNVDAFLNTAVEESRRYQPKAPVQTPSVIHRDKSNTDFMFLIIAVEKSHRSTAHGRRLASLSPTHLVARAESTL